MSNQARVLWSTLAPGRYRILVPLTPSPVVPDLSLITSCALRVVRQDGTIVPWTAAVVGTATASAATIGHVIVAGDFVLPETLYITALIYISGGSVPYTAKEFTLSVQP